MLKTISRLLIITASLFSLSLFAAPKAELWEFWNHSNPESSQTISHQKWQQILDQYLVEQGEHTLFSYANVTVDDNQKLNAYIDDLANLDPRKYSLDEQYAYWVNMYNAITVKLILDNYPIKSITKLGGFFSFGPWDDKVIEIAGETLTLNDIEHRILRPIWNDARTHYAVNCASLGCPNLQPQAFTASNLEFLLHTAQINYITSTKGVNWDGDTLVLSSIFEWFAVDFGEKEGVLELLSETLPEVRDYQGKIEYEYDWSLNQFMQQ